MKNTLIFAGFAALAAAVAIYFVNESNKNKDDGDFISDVDIDMYDKTENTGEAVTESRGFHAMS